MSKAFTKESDDERDDALPPRPTIPPGVRNWITPAGAQRLRTELADLSDRKRQLAEVSLETPARSEGETRQIQARIRHLQQILQSVIVEPPPAAGRERVRFGATVTVRQANHETATYRIVGLDETDLDRGHISFLSPLARQLSGRQAGDRISFRSPGGLEELELLAVAYE